MRKIKREDEVIVIAGKDKGKRGAVLKTLPGNKLLVSGLNMAMKHTKPNPQKGIPGGVIKKEMPLHISNVAIFNPKTGKKDKVAIRFEDGQKIRVFKSSQVPLPGK